MGRRMILLHFDLRPSLCSAPPLHPIEGGGGATRALHLLHLALLHLFQVEQNGQKAGIGDGDSTGELIHPPLLPPLVPPFVSCSLRGSTAFALGN